jgi:hypothetical protein
MAYLYINYMPTRYCTEKITGPLECQRPALLGTGELTGAPVFIVGPSMEQMADESVF